MEGRLQLRLRDGVRAESLQGVETPHRSGATHTHPRRARSSPRRTAQPHESQRTLPQGGGCTHPDPQDSGGPQRSR